MSAAIRYLDVDSVQVIPHPLPLNLDLTGKTTERESMYSRLVGPNAPFDRVLPGVLLIHLQEADLYVDLRASITLKEAFGHHAVG
jgi:hypothetical protein